MSDRPTAFTPRQAAAIAGAMYLITSATSFWNLYAASTRTLTAHAQQFRLFILFDLLTCIGCVALNASLYDLLAPVHRGLARMAAFFRLAESGVYGASTVYSVLLLSLPQLQWLRSAHAYGFSVAMVFLGFGSTIYMVLLLRSRAVPKVFPICVLAAGVFGIPFFLGRLVYPQLVTSLLTTIRGLPTLTLAALAVLFLPILLCEIMLGLWLLVKGVKEPC